MVLQSILARFIRLIVSPITRQPINIQLHTWDVQSSTWRNLLKIPHRLKCNI